MFSKLYEYVLSFFSDSKKVMWLTFITGVVCAVISIIFTKAIYRDSVEYAAMVNGFNIGDWDRAFREWLPPLYPFLCGLLCKTGFSVYYSMMTVAAVLWIITIFPLYGTLCFFMEKKYAAWGALFYILAPKGIRYGLAPLLESGKYLLLALSLYFIFRAAQSKKYRDLILLGISLGGMALMRAEGVIYIPIMLAALALLVLKDYNFKINLKFIKTICLYSLIIVITICAVISPRVYQIYQRTGYPAIDTRQSSAMLGIKNKLTGIHENRTTVQEVGLAQDYNTVGMSNSMFAFTMQDFKKFISNFPRGSYELYLILGAVGLFVLILSKRWNVKYSAVIWVFAANLVAFYLMRSHVYRYYIINVIILMPFTITGYKQLLDWSEKFKAKKLLVLLVSAIAIFQVINGMDNSIDKSKIHYQKLGCWIKANKASLKNPQHENLTILVYGEDFGYSVYSGSNAAGYRDVSSYTLNDVLKKGFPAKLCYYSMVKTPVEITFKPDIVVIDDPGVFKNVIEQLKSQPDVTQIHTGWDDKILVYKNNN